MRYLAVIIFLGAVLSGPVASAQELYNGDQGTFRAKVLHAGAIEERDIYGTGATYPVQEITVRFTEGPEKGKEIKLLNEFEVTLKKNDGVLVIHWIDISGIETYSLAEIERSRGVFLLFGIFSLFLIALAGFQGFRALVALVGSLFAIIFVLVPLIIAGHNPIFVSIAVASTVLFLALFFTHGFTRTSFAAFVGTIVAVIITGIFAWLSIDMLHLSGLASEDEVYLNLNTDGRINFIGLLLGAIIIGVLGALDDIAITQAATVRELYGANQKITRREVFARAMRVGKEHVSALVNTLILAYTGASLPLLLLFLQEGEPLNLLNIELFVVEIVRMMVGSIGLILAVPLTTLAAVWLLERYKGVEPGPKESVHHHAH